MTVDFITEEIRAIRRKLAAECGNDLTRIFADARERQAAEGRTSVILPPRRILVPPPPPVPAMDSKSCESTTTG